MDSPVNPWLSDLHTRILIRRLALHMTQREVAEQIGVSVRTLQNWEAGTGSLPRPKHRRALDAFLTEDPQVAA